MRNYIWRSNTGTVNLKRPWKNISKIYLNVSFPVSYYATINKRLKWKENGGATINILMSSGNWTANTLATEVQTLLNTNTLIGGRTYAVTFSTITGKYSVTVSPSGTAQFIVDTETIFQQMGYSVTTADTSFLLSDKVSILNGPTSLYLKSSGLSKIIVNPFHNSNSEIINDIILSIPITSNAFGFISYDQSGCYLECDPQRIVQQLDFSLVDPDTKETIDLNGGIITVQLQHNGMD